MKRAPDRDAFYPIDMWDDERRNPWRAAALYLCAMALGLLSAHGSAAGWW